jgi:hypothetical protein
MVLVLTFSAAGAVSAFPLTPRLTTAGRGGLLDKVLEWIASRVPARLIPVWEKAGSQMDPDGDPH